MSVLALADGVSTYLRLHPIFRQSSPHGATLNRTRKPMKSIFSLAAGFLLLIGGATTSNAWLVSGHVFCDANTNGVIDAGDTPRTGVLIMVANTSGTFSNNTFTGTPGGDFLITLPDTPDSYVVTVNPFNLPTDAAVVIPSGGVFTFTRNAD